MANEGPLGGDVLRCFLLSAFCCLFLRSAFRMLRSVWSDGFGIVMALTGDSTWNSTDCYGSFLSGLQHGVWVFKGLWAYQAIGLALFEQYRH